MRDHNGKFSFEARIAALVLGGLVGFLVLKTDCVGPAAPNDWRVCNVQSTPQSSFYRP